jgi:hypothetical protein
MITTKKPAEQKTVWDAQKSKLKVAFPQLKDADLNFDESRKNEMLGKLGVTLGRTTQELQLILDTNKN